jgi:hypothetical protein
MYHPGTTFDGKLAQPYDYIMDSTAVNKDWVVYDANGAPNYDLRMYTNYYTGLPQPYMVDKGDTTGEYGSPMPLTLGNLDWLTGQWGEDDGVPWVANGYNWNDHYFKVTASGITFTVRYLSQFFFA